MTQRDVAKWLIGFAKGVREGKAGKPGPKCAYLCEVIDQLAIGLLDGSINIPTEKP